MGVIYEIHFLGGWPGGNPGKNGSVTFVFQKISHYNDHSDTEGDFKLLDDLKSGDLSPIPEGDEGDDLSLAWVTSFDTEFDRYVDDLSRKRKKDDGDVAAKPGWVRCSFSPATSEGEFRVLLEAIPHIAREWRKYAEDYTMDPDTAEWHHKADGARFRSLHLSMGKNLGATEVRSAK